MNRKFSTQALVFAALGVVINLVGGWLVQATNIPLLFLDAIGTIFVAVLFGPLMGGLTGFTSNLVLGVLVSPVNIPFGIVNLVIGVVVGFIAKKWNFNLVTALITGLILSVLAPLIGSPIAVAIYGGLTGSGTDLIVLWLVKSGQKILAATFFSRVAGNLVDKVGSCLLIAVILKSLPRNFVREVQQSEA